MIYVIGPRDKAPPGSVVVNTTSRAKDNWQTGLSPFMLGPVELYDGYVADNVENGWQFSKVYPEHATDGEPNESYWKWAKAGWGDIIPHRYPMGKGRKPLYSLWKGQKLGYIEARKAIYIPLYKNSVTKSPSFAKLKALTASSDVYLWDFDGYNHHKLNMSFDNVINDPSRKMGHAFVLAMLLEGFLEP